MRGIKRCPIRGVALIALGCGGLLLFSFKFILLVLSLALIVVGILTL